MMDHNLVTGTYQINCSSIKNLSKLHYAQARQTTYFTYDMLSHEKQGKVSTRMDKNTQTHWHTHGTEREREAKFKYLTRSIFVF